MPSRPIVRILLVTLVYALLAEAGRQLALPPGYASPVWPAAGAAFAGLMLCGTTCWPGIWLGSFLFNVWMEWVTGVGISLPVATLIATGASLQAVLGVRLAQRFLDQQHPLAQRGDAFLYLWYAGPVACLVSAALGVGGLALMSRLPTDQIFQQWLAWWSGDTIGVLLFAPLVFAVHPAIHASQHLRSRHLFAVTLLVSAIIVIALAWLDRVLAASPLILQGLGNSAAGLHVGATVITFLLMLIVLASEGYSAALRSEMSERQRVEAALRNSEMFLEETGRMASVGGWQVWLDSGTVDWTEELYRLCGLTPGQPPDLETTRGMLAPDTLQSMIQLIANTLKTGQPFDIDLPFTTFDGRTAWARVVGQVDMKDGRAIRLHGASQDITDRVQMERRANHAQRLQAIGTMAGGIAHDLNNALSPIVLLVDLLHEEYPDRTEYIDLIEKSATHAADMVKQLLAFAKGADGVRSPLQPAYLLQEIAALVRNTFPKNISLQTDWQRDLPFILGDPTQLHQVLLNLCVNSRDAMADGGQLVLRARSCSVPDALPDTVLEARAGEYVLLQVEDNGCGMPADLLHRIFDPFFTTKGPEKGAGLGLASVLGIIKSHRGFLQVQSTPGQGSTFSLYLPVADDATMATATPVRKLFRGRGETVLFVDDESAVRDLAGAVLRHLGLTPLITGSGSEALALAQQHGDTIKAIITDMQMPEMDGVKLVSELRALLPHTPVIAVSGLLDEAVLQALDQLGIQQRMEKPFTLDTLSTALRQVLQPGRLA